MQLASGSKDGKVEEIINSWHRHQRSSSSGGGGGEGGLPPDGRRKTRKRREITSTEEVVSGGEMVGRFQISFSTYRNLSLNCPKSSTLYIDAHK